VNPANQEAMSRQIVARGGMGKTQDPTWKITKDLFYFFLLRAGDASSWNGKMVEFLPSKHEALGSFYTLNKKKKKKKKERKEKKNQ
jgi:hypothetical protein